MYFVSDPKKEERYLVAKDETCANDVQKHCSNVKKENNFEVFICLQNVVQVSECHNNQSLSGGNAIACEHARPVTVESLLIKNGAWF